MFLLNAPGRQAKSYFRKNPCNDLVLHFLARGQ